MTERSKAKPSDEAKAISRDYHSLVPGGAPSRVGPGLGKLEVFSGVCSTGPRQMCTLAWTPSAASTSDTAVSTE